MCNRLSDLGLKALEINKEEKTVLVTALKLLDCKAKAMQHDTASMLNEERELNCVVLSHICDQLTDRIETLFAPPAPPEVLVDHHVAIHGRNPGPADLDPVVDCGCGFSHRRSERCGPW
jgi:hypothetical protein